MSKTNPPQDPSPSHGILTDFYGKLAGKMALGAEQAARLGAMGGMSLSDPGKHRVNMSPRKPWNRVEQSEEQRAISA